MIKLTTQQQVAEAYFAMMQLKKALEDEETPDLQPGEYDLSNRELTITFHPGACVTRSEGDNGDGTENKTASQKLYGFAIIAALIHYATKKNAPRLTVKLVTEIVSYALQCDISSEAAFKKIHPRMAKAIGTVKETLRAKIGTIKYPTRRLTAGSLSLRSRKKPSKKKAA